MRFLFGVHFHCWLTVQNLCCTAAFVLRTITLYRKPGCWLILRTMSLSLACFAEIVVGSVRIQTGDIRNTQPCCDIYCTMFIK
ncbi:hypothetical protein GGR57DRAFT_87633 [Xylariaceae sp. FL1272]|nr:hypothetical protein GGR57DRAFT_87633 [Xylariaceae sp. FL1272]